MKKALLYYWLRSQSSYDNKTEYLYFPENTYGYSNKYLSKLFGYGINQVPIMMDELTDTVVELDYKNGRYKFSTDYNAGEYVYVDSDDIKKIIDKILEKDKKDGTSILLYILFVQKYQISKNRWKFTYRELSRYLGYSKANHMDKIKEAIELLEEIDMIKVSGCDGDNCQYNYKQYKQLNWCKTY